MSRPSRRTWHRRIAVEKLRLFEAGVPAIEIHLVSRLLANPSNPRYELRWQRYLAAKVAGVSPWLSMSEKPP